MALVEFIEEIKSRYGLSRV